MKTLLSLLVAAACAATATAQDPVKPDVQAKGEAAPQQAAAEIPFAGNATCPVSGKPVDKTKFVAKDGERIYTCCAKCKSKVVDAFAEFHAKAYPADAVKDLANAACPISGKPTEGKDASVTFQGRKIHFCCEKCPAKFMEQPRRNLALLENKELKALNNATCLMSEDEEEVDDDSFFVYKNLLIDTCCDDCVAEFNKNPAQYVAKIKEMAATQADKDGKSKGE